MTGSQCDNVSTHPWLVASAILQEIAHQMFSLAVVEFKERYPDDGVFDPPGLRIWKNLRRFGELYLQLRTVQFQIHEEQALQEALTFAHAFYHAHTPSAGPVRTVGYCFCPVAKLIQDLAEITAQEEPKDELEVVPA